MQKLTDTIFQIRSSKIFLRKIKKKVCDLRWKIEEGYLKLRNGAEVTDELVFKNGTTRIRKLDSG